MIELFAFSAFAQNSQHRISQLSEFLGRLLARLAPEFVDHLQDFIPPFGRNFLGTQELSPEFAVADAHDKIFFRKAERTHDVDAKRDQLDVRGERRFPDDVAVELEMFAQPSALLFFVTEKLTDGKPLERLFELALVRRDHAGQRGRELGTHRHFALAFVGEIEKLRDNFRTALFLIKVGRLKNWPIPFDKTAATGHFAPARKNVITRRAIARQEITKTGQCLHKKSGGTAPGPSILRFDATARG